MRQEQWERFYAQLKEQFRHDTDQIIWVETRLDGVELSHEQKVAMLLAAAESAFPGLHVGSVQEYCGNWLELLTSEQERNRFLAGFLWPFRYGTSIQNTVWPLFVASDARLDLPVKHESSRFTLPAYHLLAEGVMNNKVRRTMTVEDQEKLMLAIMRKAHEQRAVQPVYAYGMGESNLLESFMRTAAQDFFISPVITCWARAGLDAKKAWESYRTQLKFWTSVPASDKETALSAGERIFRLCQWEAKQSCARLLADEPPPPDLPGSDLLAVCGGGWLPQLAEGMRRQNRSAELLGWMESDVPEYYAKKYSHLMAGLHRSVPVEQSALAGWARGGAG